MDQSTMRRQTHQFIMDDPTTIEITRQTRVPDGAGGTVPDADPTPVEPQVVKVSQQRANSGVERRNADGEMVTPQIVLVCEWDADIKRDDTFVWNELDCEVVWVTDLGYVKHGEVAVR